MGADESKPRKKSSDSVTKDDVKNLLNEQKKQYELLLKAQQIKKQQEANNLLDEQKKQYELLLKAQQQKQHEAEKAASFERTPRPYSFSQNDIHLGIAQPTRTCVYENSKISSPSGISATAPSQQPPSMTQGIPYTSHGGISAIRNINQSTIITQETSRNVEHQRGISATAPSQQPLSRTPNIPSTSHGGIYATRNTNRSTITTPESSKNVEHQRPANENDELSCPTCKQSYTISIYQCNMGHSSCSNCKSRFNSCGICGSPIGDMRNISLECYLAERKVPCLNSVDGCRLIIKMADLEIHGMECPFREMLCPLGAVFGQCQWKGKLPQFSEHFKNFHPNHCTADVDNEMVLTRNETQMVHYVLLGAFNFLFHVKVSEYDRKIYMTVQLIGTKQSAGKWSYEVHVYNKNQPRRKYQYVDVCHSNGTALSEIYAEEKCAVLPFSYAENFYNKESINYKFYIKKDVDSKSSKNRYGARRRAKSVTPLDN